PAHLRRVEAEFATPGNGWWPVGAARMILGRRPAGKGVMTMALLTVPGIYKDGRIELAERPVGAVESDQVLVTSLPRPSTRPAAPEASGEDRETLRRQAFAEMREG